MNTINITNINGDVPQCVLPTHPVDKTWQIGNTHCEKKRVVGIIDEIPYTDADA